MAKKRPTPNTHPFISSYGLKVEILEEVVLDKPGAPEKQALDLLEIHVSHNGLWPGAPKTEGRAFNGAADCMYWLQHDLISDDAL